MQRFFKNILLLSYLLRFLITLLNQSRLASMAALGIALIMLLAFVYHIRRGEYKDVPATVLFFVVSVFLTFYKF